MVADTSVIIDHLRSKDKLNSRFYQILDEPQLSISAITSYELYLGATSKEKETDIQALVKPIIILPVTDEIAIAAAKIYLQLRRKNKLIEFRDIFIAATCIVHELPIVTLNKKHFQRIDGLIIF